MLSTDWLEAGGLTGTVADPSRIDSVDARSYRHPGISGRTVVRLVPHTTAAGDLAEATLHGFVLESIAPGVGVQIKRTLGFPGWVLVNDPTHARLALDVWKEMRVFRRRIAAKPGAAKDGITEIAKRLSGSVPSFLPTFWEETGRWFSEAGNTTMLRAPSSAQEMRKPATGSLSMKTGERRFFSSSRSWVRSPSSLCRTMGKIFNGR